jgi:hypothetical protein
MSSSICDCYFPLKIGRKKRCLQRGISKEPLYTIWRDILYRCSSEKYVNREYYLDRGIGVCSQWQEDFNNFKKDIGERPSVLHSVDRVDNNKGYCPHNVKWSTQLEQSHNTRKHRAGSSNLLPGIRINQNKTLHLTIRINNEQLRFNGFTSLYDTFLFRMKTYKEAYGIEDHNYVEAIRLNIERIREHSEEDFVKFSRHI